MGAGLALPAPQAGSALGGLGPATESSTDIVGILYSTPSGLFSPNGEELDLMDALELGVDVPSNLPPGTPQKYWGPFQQGFNAALKDLKKKKCGKFYGGQGPATMNATQYRFLDVGNPNMGAETVDPSSVFINSAGPYMTFSPTPGQAGPFGLYWTQSQFRAFILLHELGHQLSPITGFQPDAGSPLNQTQSMQVIGACF